MSLADIAARNVAARRAMLSRLAPVKTEARQKSDALYKARSGTKDTRKTIEMMSSLSHVPGFFPTPRKLVERMIEEAALQPGMAVLEPSAGKGDIAAAVLGAGVAVTLLQCVERNYTLAKYLSDRGYYVRQADFLEYEVGQLFDRVLMNPPFDRGVDEKHIRHAFNFLRPGGRLVGLACSTTGRRLEPWAGELGGFVKPLPAGSFATSDRPTQVNTSLIVLNK